MLTTFFRQIDGPPRWMDGIHWQAELHDDEAGALGELPYPVAVAWLTDFRGTAMDCVLMDFVLVPDHFRRRGYATKLIGACAERWPELRLTEAISEAGEGLLAKVADEEGPGKEDSIP
jgi:GNAT superfamily N-acetyltransferase